MILIKMAENCGSDVYGALLFSRRSTAIGMRTWLQLISREKISKIDWKSNAVIGAAKDASGWLVPARLLPPQVFRPEGEIPRRHSRNSRVYQGKYLQLKYTVSMPEKMSICLNRGREESVGIKWWRFYCLHPQVRNG